MSSEERQREIDRRKTYFQHQFSLSEGEMNEFLEFLREAEEI